MLDTPLRRALAPALDIAAKPLAAAGVPPLVLTGIGWLGGLGACAAAAAGQWNVALGLWIFNRVMDGLDGPVARRQGSTELGGFLDIIADFSIYAGFIVGVAIAIPDARLACIILLMFYYISGTAFLTLSALWERRGGQGDERSVLFVGGLAEGTETIAVYILICLMPGHATTIVWVFALAVAITAGQRIAFGIRILKHPIVASPL